MKAGDTIYLPFSVFQADGVTRLTGQAGSVTDSLVFNNAASAQPVTIAEIGSTGRYHASFIPNAVGQWDLELTLPSPDLRVVGGYWDVEAKDIDALNDLAAGAAMDLVNDAVDAASVATGAIDADAIAANAITAGKIAASAIGATQIATGAITSVKFASGAVTASAIAANAIGATQIGTGAISNTKIADNAISDAKINAGAITAAKIASSALTAAKFGSSAITSTVLADNAITAAKLNANAITAAKVATDAIGAAQLAIDAVNEIRNSILSDATPFAGANVDAAISSRSDFDETTDPVELLDSGGAAGTSAVELVTDIEADLAVNHGSGQWDATATVPAQTIRDAMKLAPTVGAPAVGSIDEHLDDVLTDTAAIDGRLPADPADESLQQASHAQTQADIASLNNLSQADVQAGMTAQGYTAGRAPNLDNLDATVGSRETESAAAARDGVAVAERAVIEAAIAALNDLGIMDIQTALTAQGYTTVRAALLDNLDAAVSSRSSHDAVDVDAVLTAAHGSGAWSPDTACHAAVAYDVANQQIHISGWLTRSDVQVTAPTSATFTWRNEGGAALFSKTESDLEVTGPDAQGVFLLVTAVGDFVLLSKQAYYLEVSITDATGTVTTVRGVPTAG